MKYYAADGTYQDYAPGLYFVRASGAEDARWKIRTAIADPVWSNSFDESTLQPIRESVKHCVDLIKEGAKDLYTQVSRDVYYFET